MENPTQQKKTHRLVKQIRLIDILNLTAIVSIAGYIMWALFFPFNVIDIKNLNADGKIPMTAKKYQAGQYAKYKVKAERHSDRTITVIRSIVNGQSIPLSANLSNREAGLSEFIVELLLPANLNPGMYSFRICYQADFPLDRTVAECFETERFEVFLPEGVDPDADGLTVPATDNTLPSEQYTPDSPTDRDSESDGNQSGGSPTQSRLNYVEENPPDHTTGASSGGSSTSNPDAGQPLNESPLCGLVEMETTLLIPIRIC